MSEHPKFKLAKQLCADYGLRCKIVGVDGALWVYIPTIGKFQQACFSLLNLSEDQIREMIKHVDDGSAWGGF